MAMTRTFYLDAEHARERMKGIWRIVCEYMLAGKQVRLRVDEKKPTRTLEQNDLMWTILGDIARLVRPCDDLNLLCRVCNAAHYLETKYGELPFLIVWGGRRVR